VEVLTNGVIDDNWMQAILVNFPISYRKALFYLDSRGQLVLGRSKGELICRLPNFLQTNSTIIHTVNAWLFAASHKNFGHAPPGSGSEGFGMRTHPAGVDGPQRRNCHLEFQRQNLVGGNGFKFCHPEFECQSLDGGNGFRFKTWAR